MNDLTRVIHSFQISEKATVLTELNNEYVFRVDPRATKVQIRQAVENLLGKKVANVNTMNYSGKIKRKRRADQGRTASFKKAIVRLAEGESLDLV